MPPESTESRSSNGSEDEPSRSELRRHQPLVDAGRLGDAPEEIGAEALVEARDLRARGGHRSEVYRAAQARIAIRCACIFASIGPWPNRLAIIRSAASVASSSPEGSRSSISIRSGDPWQ